MFECLGCGVAIPKRGSLVRYYCSNRCQRALERRQKTERWLATGEAFVATTQDHYVRSYIAEQQQGLCAICAMANVWNGLPLRFVLDHIDGNSTNNRRENLRLVCPNCDSQLPTFKSRNRGKGRHVRRVRYENGQSY